MTLRRGLLAASLALAATVGLRKHDEEVVMPPKAEPPEPPALPPMEMVTLQSARANKSFHQRYTDARIAFQTEKPEGKAAARRRRQMEKNNGK